MDFIRPSRRILGKIEKPPHGGDVWNYPDKKVIDFSSNVNPLGPPQRLLKGLKACMREICSYPEIDGIGARKAISRYFSMPMENLHLANGSSEIIKNFCEAFIDEGDQVIILEPTYSEYEYFSRLYGASVVHATPDGDFTHDMDRIIGSINSKTRAVFICNPNNPTGTYIDKGDMLRLLDNVRDKGVIIFIDEAYIHFSPGESLLHLCMEYPNLLVLHSLTKFFSIPGLRIGFCAASGDIAETLEKVRPPWNVNHLAQRAVELCLEDSDFISMTGKFIEEEREFLYSGLRDLKGIEVIPSRANFFIIDITRIGTSVELKKKLLGKGLLVRDCSSFFSMGEKFLRLCIRTRGENLLLLKALGELS